MKYTYLLQFSYLTAQGVVESEFKIAMDHPYGSGERDTDTVKAKLKAVAGADCTINSIIAYL